MVGMLAALSTLWSFVWGCDADCSIGCGEHSTLHFVKDSAGGVLCRADLLSRWRWRAVNLRKKMKENDEK